MGSHGYGNYESGADRYQRSLGNDRGARGDSTATELEELRARLDRMALFTEALWQILTQRVGIEEAELLEAVRALDLSDGKLDGKVKPTAVTCPSCERVIAKRRHQCIYCGTEIARAPFGSI